MAKVAYLSLGRVGSRESLSLLMDARPADGLKEFRCFALANNLERLVRSDDMKAAVPVAKKLYADKGLPDNLRAAAARVLVLDDEDFFVTAMKDPSFEVWTAAIRSAGKVDVDELEKALEGATPYQQRIIMARMAENGDRDGAEACEERLSSSDEGVVCAALQALSVIGSADSVDKILPLLSKGGAVAGAATFALQNIPDKKVGKRLFKLAEKNPALIPILGERMESALIERWEPLVASENAQVRKDAWRAIGKNPSAKLAPVMLGWLKRVKESELNLAETTIRTTLRFVPSELCGEYLGKAWEDNSSLTAKKLLLGLMGTYSTGKNLELIASALTGEASLCEVACESLGNWKTLEPLPSIKRAYALQKESSAKRALIRAALNLVSVSGGARKGDLFTDLFKSAEEGHRSRVALMMFHSQGIEVFDLLEGLFSSPDCGVSAKKCYVMLYDKNMKDGATVGLSELNRTGWKLNASNNPAALKNTVDNNPKSRWDSHCPSTKGMWVSVDLGRNTFVDKVILDTTASAKDTPNGCAVFTSTDGKNWTGPVARVDGKSVKVTEIKIGKSTRYLKFVTLAGRPNLYWSIHELKIIAGLDRDKLDKIAKTAGAIR